MALTAKQEAFAQAIADGMTQSDAYRSAYDAENMKDTSIHVNASQVMSDPKVALRVKELKEKLSEKALWTREMSVMALVEAYQIGRERANTQGITGAIKELNAMHGYNAPQKLDLTSSDGTMTPKPVFDPSKLSKSALAEIMAQYDPAKS